MKLKVDLTENITSLDDVLQTIVDAMAVINSAACFFHADSEENPGGIAYNAYNAWSQVGKTWLQAYEAQKAVEELIAKRVAAA